MATTKEDVRQKVYSLIDDMNVSLKKQCDNILESGVIDFDNEEPHWGLPKDIINALIPYIECSHRHPHPTRKWHNKIKKLRIGINYWQ